LTCYVFLYSFAELFTFFLVVKFDGYPIPFEIRWIWIYVQISSHRYKYIYKFISMTFLLMDG
jgi:hypothetical protein